MRYLALFSLASLLLASSADFPHLEKRGSATQLIVDGKPFLMLAAELHNSSSSSLDYMRPIWPKLAAIPLNTVLTPVSWELIEPAEGQFEFGLVDGLIRTRAETICIWSFCGLQAGRTVCLAMHRFGSKKMPAVTLA